MGNVYIIKNDVNDKVYIGITTNTIEERFKNHMKESTIKQKIQYKFYNEVNKIGKEHFYIELLEQCQNSDLERKEIYYINKYNSYYNGYNSTKGGYGGKSFVDKTDEYIISCMYLNGYDSVKLGKLFNVHPITIQRTIKRNNFKVRKDGRKLTDDYKDIILKLCSNYSYNDVSNIFSVNEKTIRRFCKKYGFSKNKK